MKPQILPCPWCHKTEGLNLVEECAVKWVECLTCLATGPAGLTKKAAVELWNGAKVRKKRNTTIKGERS